MIILGIETSCDETSASIIKEYHGNFFVLSNIVSSQVKIHSQWGGVVPNLAAREHLKNIIPVFKKCFKKANIKPEEIDFISVTNGPGLIPALLIGVNAAKTLSYIWKKPLLGIHHIEGHIYANFMVKFPVSNISHSDASWPILCLVVSGGHTQLVLMKKHLNYRIIGETLDDAAGEAFDKVARILNIGYPGGPAIAARADTWASTMQKKRPRSIEFTRPMISSKDFNFSFSGLKTAVLYEVKKHPELQKNKLYISEVCYEFQQAVCDVLISKTLRAARKYKPKIIMLAGGVSANKELRNRLGKEIKKNLKNVSYGVPKFEYCADNAAMIAVAGFYRWKNHSGKKNVFNKNWKNLSADANLKLKNKL